MKTSRRCSVAFEPATSRQRRSWCGGTSQRSVGLRAPAGRHPAEPASRLDGHLPVGDGQLLRARPGAVRAGIARAVAQVARDDDAEQAGQPGEGPRRRPARLSPGREPQWRERRERCRSCAGIEGLAGPADTPATRSRRANSWQEARRRLSPEELSLLERREQGCEWTEIAAELGSSPEAIRKRLARAIDRVAHELGLDQPDS